MNELIKISQNNQGFDVVSARELHRVLESKERFADFISRAFSYGFVEGKDYTPEVFLHPQNKQEFQDFALTIRCAKEIAMIQRSDIGKKVRDYFMDIEERHNKPAAMDPFDIIQWNLDRLKAQAKEIKSLQTGQAALAEKVNEIEAKQSVINEDYYALSGYYSLKGRVFKLPTTKASQTGKMLVKKSNELGYIVNYTYSAKYGKVNTYHKFVLQAVLGF